MPAGSPSRWRTGGRCLVSAFVVLSLAFAGNAFTVSCRRHATPGVPADGVSRSAAAPVAGGLPAMRFVPIPAGSFEMGSDSPKAFDQSPLHPVTISRPFEMAATEVTEAQWKAVMGSNPSHFQGDDLPVEQVSWQDVQEFLRRLEALDPASRYRLPTEAEWEYACRAGTTESRTSDLSTVAWFIGSSEQRTHPVGQLQPNAWGLYDMLGNVWELCSDWKAPYPPQAVTDPTGPPSGFYKVSRGGSWFDAGAAVSATFRASPEPAYRGSSLGFRLVRGPR